MPSEDIAEVNDGPDLTTDEREAVSEAEDVAAPVSYSGTDFDVEGLVRRLDRGDIVVPTFGSEDESLETAGFQRKLCLEASTNGQVHRVASSRLSHSGHHVG